MFDKYKERKQRVEEAIEKFEAAHQNVAKAHAHVSKHRGKYGTAVGVGVTVLVMKRFGAEAPDVAVTQTAKIKAGIQILPTNTINQVQETIVVQAKGNPGDVIMRVGDGMKWPSKNEMAKDLGVARSIVTRYFAGEIPDIKGETFIDLGKAGHVLAVPTAA